MTTETRVRASGPGLAAALAILNVGCGGASPASEGGLTPDQRAEIRAAAATPIEEGRAAGMSVAVVRGSDTLLIEAFGHADIELNVATPPDAVYEIGSVTKQFTAAALLLLREEGTLSLDDPLTRWLPDYPTGGRTVTLRRLLDHTSGIKGYTEMEEVWNEIAPLALPRDTLVTLFAAEPFEFEPGTAMTYNNSAYFLAGLVIEAASGMSYEDFVEARLFAPAGMEDSRYCHKEELVPNRAKGYEPGGAPGDQGSGDRELRPAPYLNHLWPYAAGSLCSTARDLVAWNQALHGDGEGDGGGILSPESYRLMITPEPLLDGSQLRYAKGLARTDRAGAARIGHGGGIFGFVSDLRYLPEEDLSIAVLINTAGGVAPSQIAARIEDVLLGPPPETEAIPFDGDPAPFVGRYEGPARGQRLVAEVSIEDGRLTIDGGGNVTEPLTWLGGDAFARGRTRFRFVRAPNGTVTELRVDVVSGHHVLQRIDP